MQEYYVASLTAQNFASPIDLKGNLLTKQTLEPIILWLEAEALTD